MSDAQSYRERAELAERLAGAQKHPAQRDELLLLAAEWRALAHAAERRERRGPRH